MGTFAKSIGKLLKDRQKSQGAGLKAQGEGNQP